MHSFKFNKNKKVTAYVVLPLLIALLAYFLAGAILYTTCRPLFSIFGLLYGKENAYTTQTSLYSPATRQRGTIGQSQITYPKQDTHYAKIKLPGTDKSEDLYYGDSDYVLKKGIGQYSGTLLPGYNSPILLAGHNNTYFNNLKKIKKGQVVEITTYYGIYKYKVIKTAVKKSDDKSAYDLLQNKEQLIMYTCYPFDMLGITNDRFYVYADLISGPEIVDD